jgi:hypothetical protein
MPGMERSELNGTQAQLADLLVARAIAAVPRPPTTLAWPLYPTASEQHLTRELRAHLRRPHPRQAERTRAGMQLHPAQEHPQPFWQPRPGRFRTVADVRAPLRGPRYAWCYRKYSPR